MKGYADRVETYIIVNVVFVMVLLVGFLMVGFLMLGFFIFLMRSLLNWNHWNVLVLNNRGFDSNDLMYGGGLFGRHEVMIRSYFMDLFMSMTMAIVTDYALRGDSMTMVFGSGGDSMDFVNLHWGFVFCFMVVGYSFLWRFVMCLVLDDCFEGDCVMVMVLAVCRHHKHE